MKIREFRVDEIMSAVHNRRLSWGRWRHLLLQPVGPPYHIPHSFQVHSQHYPHPVEEAMTTQEVDIPEGESATYCQAVVD